MGDEREEEGKNRGEGIRERETRRVKERDMKWQRMKDDSLQPWALAMKTPLHRDLLRRAPTPP